MGYEIAGTNEDVPPDIDVGGEVVVFAFFVTENVNAPREPAGLARDDLDETTDDVLKGFELGDYLDDFWGV